MKIESVLAAFLLATSLAPFHEARAAAETRLLAQVELIKPTPVVDQHALPTDAPSFVLYYLSGSHAPSCGLLPSAAGADRILPMVEPEAGQDWPVCLGSSGATTFDTGIVSGFVFAYRQRDTREDTSSGYFFVERIADGELRSLDTLNDETTPEKKSIRYMAAWAKSRLAGIAETKDGFEVSKSDSIVTDTAFLNVSRNARSSLCRFVIDTADAHARFAPVITPCKGVLASTSFTSGKATYFIVLEDTDAGLPKGLILVVSGADIREATELETRLATEIAGKKVLAVRQALKKQVE